MAQASGAIQPAPAAAEAAVAPGAAAVAGAIQPAPAATSPAPVAAGAAPPSATPAAAAGATQVPHDIRGLAPDPAPAWTAALWASLAVALLAGLAAALWAWRRRRARRPPPPGDPWQALSARLAALRPAAPFEPLAQEDFYYQLSLLLREAIELRTGVRATDLTCRELKEPLRRRLPLPRGEGDDLYAFLERADLVKFAAAPADLAEAAAAAARVGGWLARLTPLSLSAAADAVPGRAGGSDAAG